MDEREESQYNDTDWIFNKIKEENFSKLWKDVSLQIQETHQTLNGQNQKRKSSWHIVVKTPSSHSKEGIEGCKRKHEGHM